MRENIDTFQQQGLPIVGYQLLFVPEVMYCIVGTVAVCNVNDPMREAWEYPEAES